VTNGGFVSPVVIAPINSAAATWITVLIGENGTKKSFLLRLLTEAALGRTRFRHAVKRRYATLQVAHTDLPVRVIAVSGTPLDRFPRTGTPALSSSKNKRLNVEDPFVYLGQRAVNGMAGVGQSERSLVGSLLTNRSRLNARREALTAVFGHLGLRPRVEVKLRLAAARDNDVAKLALSGTLKAFRQALNSQLDALKARFEKDTLSSRHVRELSAFQSRIEPTAELKRFRANVAEFASAKLAFSLAPTRSGTRVTSISVAEWELLLRIGLVEIDGTQFVRSPCSEHTAKASPREYVQGDELSSGQWSWLGSTAGLAVELRINCLVLIDEPENSLHPAWQREYVSHIEKLIQPYPGTQVVIATHSPLIASGIAPASGNVRHLHRKYDKETDVNLVQSNEEASTYGWTANDVYETVFDVGSTRAESFTDTAKIALQIIKKGTAVDRDQFKGFEAELTLAADSLPPFDPMRAVFSNIMSSLKELKAK
jgi:hypothetical protein